MTHSSDSYMFIDATEDIPEGVSDDQEAGHELEGELLQEGFNEAHCKMLSIVW